ASLSRARFGGDADFHVSSMGFVILTKILHENNRATLRILFVSRQDYFYLPDLNLCAAAIGHSRRLVARPHSRHRRHGKMPSLQGKL
ncbi:MAG: hypothetical protein ABI476_08290, partial [Oxalobacteraceae bacterium]